MTRYTPMIEQYLHIKKEHNDCILFFRLGDFYEMFFDDAHLASKELEIVLTARDGGPEKIPMCGIPYHSAANYISKLIARGRRVAICEQVEDSKDAQGLVKREVTRIITPGTLMDDKGLEENKNNYLAAAIRDVSVNGFAYIDITTGEFEVTELSGETRDQKLESELLRVAPAELLLNLGCGLEQKWQLPFLLANNIATSSIPEYILSLKQAQEIITKQFQIQSVESFGLKGRPAATMAGAAIIAFLNDTQKTNLKQIQRIRFYNTEAYLEMDAYTRRNLELTHSIRETNKDNSLLFILDNCCTSMGRRQLRQWIELPLKHKQEIEKRLDGVAELVSDLLLRDEIKTLLNNIYDLERIAGKIGSNIANPRDFLALKKSLEALKNVDRVLVNTKSTVLKDIAKLDKMKDLGQLIEMAVDEEAPFNIKEGGIIKSGYNKEIDDLKGVSARGSNWLMEFEAREKERTGMKFLKVGFNKVFGYYIEITKSNLSLVPDNYIRKQTLVNTERFICDELKQYEDKILGAREKLYLLEYEAFIDLRSKVSGHINRIQQTAHLIAKLDVLYSLALTAYNNDYVRPVISNNAIIDITSGRHPVVEKNLKDTRFVPNDTHLGVRNKNFLIITGPNMGGKSTYMRQTALLVLMAQMGSFVPAESAAIGIVDQIFTRVGASDDLAAGQSTFMVEMLEVANILHNASSKSLIILDEIGRGTSTYDGMSIAQSTSEYILDKIKARTLFATHYHELTDLADQYPQIENLSVSVYESEDTVVFLRKVLPGRADKSYGIQVARLAGLPLQVISRAQEILKSLEKGANGWDMGNSTGEELITQPSLFVESNPILTELEELDINNLTPLDALNLLNKWKQNVNR